MAVPKKRKSKAKTRSRRSHNDRMVPTQLQRCDHCFAPKLPHRVCPECGKYREEQVIEVWEE